VKLVLIVDDEFGLAEALCDLLVNVGYQADKAWNGQLALKKIAAHPPALVLADVMMPIMDGHQLLREIKAKPEWKNIPVVFMSAATHLGPEELDGAAAFIAKPFDIDQLLDVIRKLIGDGASGC
jgi:CheY-like chemotaxis protein